MVLELLVELLSAGGSLPERISRSILAITMLLAGLCFLALSLIMAAQVATTGRWALSLFSVLALGMSILCFRLMNRAFRRARSDET